MAVDLIGQPKSALDTPALLVDLDVMERNIAKMRSAIVERAGVQWRPHTKALKSPEIARKLLDAGAAGVTCAKLGEAEVMAAGGIGDILVANQVVGPAKVTRLVKLRPRANVIVAVDDLDNVEMIDRAAIAAGVRVRVIVEVDIGMHRAGRLPGPDAVAFARQVADRRGVELAGLMAWEAHALVHRDHEVRGRVVRSSVGKLIDTAEECRHRGVPIDIVSCGGTGTYWITAFVPGVTEIQAGGGVFGDLLYSRNFGVDHECGLTVLATVTSRPTAYRIVCDSGVKTLSRDPVLPEPIGVDGVRTVGLSAEHGAVTLSAPSSTPRVGEKVEFIVGYSDTTTVLHDEVYGVRAGVVETVWPLSGRGKLR